MEKILRIISIYLIRITCSGWPHRDLDSQVLSGHDASILVTNALISSRLDYCYSVFSETALAACQILFSV